MTELGLTILGGYLGAGKTTWARHQLRQGAFGADVHVLVNEAAETGVDDVLLPGRVTLLSGGCACCTGLPRLIQALREICDQRSRGEGPGHVLLETSGLADPGAIARGIAADPVLLRHLRVTETITLVDALHGLAQLTADARGQAQVAAADRLVLTKTEAAPTLATLCATLALLNPAASLTAAHLGEPVPLPDMEDPGPLPRLSKAMLDLSLVELPLPATSWTRFQLWLSALLQAHGADLVRVKGFVPLETGAILLQAVHDHVQPPELLPLAPGATGRLVLFGRGLEAAVLAASLERFARV